MGNYTVSLGGKEYDVDAPDEKTAWKWAKTTHLKGISSQGVAQPAPTPFRSSGETALSPGEEVLANPYGRAAIGALKPIIGTGQVALNAVGQGEGINREMSNLAQSTAKAREYVGSRGADVADMVGQGATFALPTGLVRQAATTTGRIGQGMLMGGAAGASEPVYDPSNYWSTKGGQVIGGAVAGGVLPAGWELAKAGGRGVRNVVQPYLGEWGAERAAGRLANATAGDKADQIIGQLSQPRSFIPGSAPTAAQAAVPAGSAEFSALGKIAAERDPSKYAALEKAQNEARVAALRSVGGTPQDLASAERARAAAAGKNYGEAYAQAIKGDAALMKMSKNPFFKDAFSDATRLAQAEGINPKENLTRFLHFVKVSLDKQLTRTGDNALGRTEKGAVEDIKNRLVTWLGEKNPAYDTARQTFAAQSKPINQMEIGQFLEGKLDPAIGARQRALAYAQALRDAPGTIKRATGQPRYDSLGQVMSPEQMETLRAVRSDLGRDLERRNLAQTGMPAANEAIGRAIPEAPPTGMFSPIISVTRGLYNRATGKATDKILNDLAQHMDNPQKIADMMRKAKPFERQAMVDVLMRGQAGGLQAVQDAASQDAYAKRLRR